MFSYMMVCVSECALCVVHVYVASSNDVIVKAGRPAPQGLGCLSLLVAMEMADQWNPASYTIAYGDDCPVCSCMCIYSQFLSWFLP